MKNLPVRAIVEDPYFTSKNDFVINLIDILWKLHFEAFVDTVDSTGVMVIALWPSSFSVCYAMPKIA